jgi:hypothetical protein
MSAWDRPNGMRIERVRVPLGVIGIIYESRPNVTVDAGAHSSRPECGDPSRGSIALILRRHSRRRCGGLSSAGVPETAIQWCQPGSQRRWFDAAAPDGAIDGRASQARIAACVQTGSALGWFLLISTAIATSMWTRPPTPKWRDRSC